MATRGRKPTPTAIKELEGNPGKRPLNKNEPKPTKKAPPCPKWLEPEAKKEWRRLAKKMEQLGVLTEVDMAAFAGYCQAYARWKEAEEFITQHGSILRTKSGYVQPVPQVSIAQTYLKIMNRFAEQFGLSAYDARQLVEGEQTAGFFEKCMEAAGADAKKLAKPVANLVINDIAGWQNANEDANLADSPLSPARAVELVGLLAEDAISSKQAKEVFAAVMDEDKDPAAIVEERGMKQVSDTGAIEAVVDAVIAANPDEVARYKDGNTKVIGFFVGQCMKQMRGQGNPKVINQLLAKKLAE